MTSANPNISDAVKMNLLLEFETAFPGEQPLTPEEYLKGGDRDLILNSAAFLLGFKSQNSKFQDNREFFQMYFCAENNAFANQVYNRIRELEKAGNRVLIVNQYSSLTLFEYFFQREDEERTQTSAELELNLFKAYLVFNSAFTEAQRTAYTSTELYQYEVHFLPVFHSLLH